MTDTPHTKAPERIWATPAHHEMENPDYRCGDWWGRECNPEGAVEYVRADLTGWQTMETAPKDGTEVLVAFYGEVFTAKYLKSNLSNDAPFFVTTVNGDPWDCANSTYRVEYEYLPVTHWMPLPAPPEGQP